MKYTLTVKFPFFFPARVFQVCFRYMYTEFEKGLFPKQEFKKAVHKMAETVHQHGYLSLLGQFYEVATKRNSTADSGLMRQLMANISCLMREEESRLSWEEEKISSSEKSKHGYRKY